MQIFPSSLRIKDLAEAEAKLAGSGIATVDRKKYLNLLQILISAPADEGITTDELMVGAGFEATALREALYLFDRLGISSNDTGMTAFLHVGVENASKKRFEAACALETALIAQLRETAPDAIAGDGYPLNLRLLAQRLKDDGYAQALPHGLGLILKGLAGDGRDGPDGRGSITLKRGNDPETVFVALNRSWAALDKTAERRRTAAALPPACCSPTGCPACPAAPAASTCWLKPRWANWPPALPAMPCSPPEMDTSTSLWTARCSGCTNKTSCA